MSEAGRLKKGRAEREGGAGTASPYSTGTRRPSCGCEERLFAVRSSPARSEFLKTMNSLGEVREEGMTDVREVSGYCLDGGYKDSHGESEHRDLGEAHEGRAEVEYRLF